MHGISPPLDQGASTVTRIALAMRSDSDDGLGYSGVERHGVAYEIALAEAERNDRG